MIKQQRARLREEMEYHLTTWQQSGQSQKQYCQENNLRFAKFAYWQHKLRNPVIPLSNTFLPVSLQATDTVTKGNELEVTYPNGVRLKVISCDAQFIGRLIRLI